MVRTSWLPLVIYLICAIFLFGTLSWVSSSMMLFEDSNRDIWQHAAAIRALMADIVNPSNPFVVSDASSRHFSPLWAGWAVVARIFDLSVWDVLTIATYVSMMMMAVAVYLFARSYYASPWAPLVLLLVMLFGWAIPIQHTGFHSFETLTYAAVYPATYMISMSLFLWAATIHALTNVKWAPMLAILAAVMFATHQLGAVIGLIGAGCFAISWPNGSLQLRVYAIIALLLGLMFSCLWVFHNPLLLVLDPGNSNWKGGPHFYGIPYLTAVLLPSGIGLFGLTDRRSRPLAIALVCMVCAYLIGLSGVKLAGRFLMPISLILQIGLTSCIIGILSRSDLTHTWRSVQIGSISCVVFASFTTALGRLQAFDERQSPNVSVYSAAQALTHDISDFDQVAAFGLTAWPVVATGQRVLSIPWPEPLIPDLSQRQKTTDLLFSTALEDREQHAIEATVRTLIADRRNLTDDALQALESAAHESYSSGTLYRFDF